MRVAYFEPLQRAWERMKHILWQPFDLAKWIVLGFSAWLAGLADGAGGGGWKYVSDDNDLPINLDLHDTGAFWNDAGAAILWLPLIFILIMAVAAILLAILWVSSRAKFVYLDNVIHNRAQIVEPWQRLRDLGNSLFLWRVGFIVAIGLAVLVLLIIFFAPAATLSLSDFLGGLSYAAMGFGFMIMIAVGIAAAYVGLFLEGFVIPIMYKYDLKATEAWRYFIPWLKARPWNFVLYGLFVLVLIFCFVAIFGLLCLMTCCIVALPYIGTVILLPLYVVYRLFSLEFLGQFDPGFDFFAVDDAVVEGED